MEVFLVERNATTLNELAHLALAWEDLHALLIEEIYGCTTEQVLVEVGEDLDILLSIIIAYVQPVPPHKAYRRQKNR